MNKNFVFLLTLPFNCAIIFLVKKRKENISNMEKIMRVGIVGCGNISNSHMQAYRKNPNVEVVACCDINKARAEAYAKAYGIKSFYGSIDEMLEKEEHLDSVSVCTWNNGHYECSMKAMKAHKNVLVEKPMAMNAKQALEMQEEAKKQGVVLQVGFVKRFAKTTKIFQDFQASDTFGNIYLTKAIYTRRVGNPGGWFSDKSKSGGGPLIDLGVHVIDLSRYLMGMHKPVSVYGATFNKLGDKLHIKGIGHYHPVDFDEKTNICDVEDSVIALIRFDNGSVLHVEASFTLNIKEGITTLQLFGDKGGATLEPHLEIYKDVDDYLTNITPVIDYASDVFGDMFANEINHFYDCCVNHVKCLAPAEDGVVLMKILDAIYESARTGHEVKIQ